VEKRKGGKKNRNPGKKGGREVTGDVHGPQQGRVKAKEEMDTFKGGGPRKRCTWNSKDLYWTVIFEETKNALRGEKAGMTRLPPRAGERFKWGDLMEGAGRRKK